MDDLVAACMIDCVGPSQGWRGYRLRGGKESPPQLFVVVLPEGGNDIYTIVKQYVRFFLSDSYSRINCGPCSWGDVTVRTKFMFCLTSTKTSFQQGVVTQCLKSRNCTGANMQFWANVALK